MTRPNASPGLGSVKQGRSSGGRLGSERTGKEDAMASANGRRKRLFTSESVTEGHPDKLCDQIANAVLDAMLGQDPASRVACEVLATTGFIVVAGEITARAAVDVADVVRRTVAEVGYDRPETGFDAHTCEVNIALHRQSPDIAQGVDQSLEARASSDGAADDKLLSLGAGDQGLMFGYATDETQELMPFPILLAHRLARQLAMVRKEGKLPWLRPDGKTQVTVEYDGSRKDSAYGGKPVRVVSAQHSPDVSRSALEVGIRELVIRPVIPERYLDGETRFLTNPTGRFVLGGPQTDTGLTGRKIIVDCHGGMDRHGGAFSGKDPTKVNRSGAYAARYVAKNIVAAGLAKRCEVQFAYAIGVARPVSVRVETFGTGAVPNDRIADLVERFFDLRPGAVIRHLDLWRPMYRPLAAYGHFGRVDVEAARERTDRASLLRVAVFGRGANSVSHCSPRPVTHIRGWRCRNVRPGFVGIRTN